MLDLSIFRNLQPVAPPPNPLDTYAKVLALKNQAIQGQDLQSQIIERQSQAQKNVLAQQKLEAAQQVLTDPTNYDTSTGRLHQQGMQKLMQANPDFALNLSKEYDARDKQAAADTETHRHNLAEEKNVSDKNAFEQQKETTAQNEKQAQEAAGTLIPGTEFTTPDQNGKPTRAAQFRVRQPDGSYRNETRTLGAEAAAPQNPPQPQAPMSAERFAQELQLEKLKAANANAIPPLNFLKETSSTGVPFIDASKVEPKTLNALQTSAGQAGVKVVDKDTAQGLRDIATAKANQQSMMDLLNGRLAENPLSRLFVAPENKLKKLGQLDPNLAVTGTFVGPAIQSLRAVAGAKGFRITKPEIDNAIVNFVPQASDTVDVAKAKMAALAHFMDNKEMGALGTTGTAPSTGNARIMKFDAQGNPIP